MPVTIFSFLYLLSDKKFSYGLVIYNIINGCHMEQGGKHELLSDKECGIKIES
jgi:hypothetical protein